ncbi:hypothetical protein CWB72_07195 [Pseudoalteromonas phenolica]|uniref:hypothetical protein n=1 Tax=Pseudoalteromonas phenolica TaxID=161398 RepID=UPI00110B2155|nr:hypothetical protein [Pseudoalteromonas phenolica]TMN91429.1 hypothetical protein CWB72_07195 [Pseudoalteromonas phenolica]
MDAFKPLLNNIIRLEVSHKPTFYVAGVIDNKVEKIKLDRAKKEDAKRKLNEQSQNKKQKENENDKEDGKHLDVWA